MHDISIAVLAGGRSRRMGQNKSFVLLDGKPLIVHVLETLALLERPITIVTHSPEAYAHYGVPTAGDISPNHGALGGIYTAIRTSTARYVLVAACDMPLLNLELLRYMISRCTDADGVVAWLNNMWQSFPGIYSQRCCKALGDAIAKEQLSLQAVLNTLLICAPTSEDLRPFDPDLRTFTNINTLDDLSTANKKFERR